jgi:hypothetical protein
MQDMYGWIKEPCQPLIAELRSIEILDLLVKHGENGSGRTAGLELGGEWMGKKIFVCLFLVRLQGIIEDQLEIG